MLSRPASASRSPRHGAFGGGSADARSSLSPLTPADSLGSGSRGGGTWHAPAMMLIKSAACPRIQTLLTRVRGRVRFSDAPRPSRGDAQHPGWQAKAPPGAGAAGIAGVWSPGPRSLRVVKPKRHQAFYVWASPQAAVFPE